jgi:two-component system chemotaxis response regulator CheB
MGPDTLPPANGSPRPKAIHMGRDIIVIGASAGGLEAVLALLRAMPNDRPAAAFVVTHVGRELAGFPPPLGDDRTRFTPVSCDRWPADRARTSPLASAIESR